MDYSLSRQTDLRNNSGQAPTQQPKMSILAMSVPSPYPAFRNDLLWDSARSSSGSSRPRTESKHVALPSIRQVSSNNARQMRSVPYINASKTFPDLHLDGSLADVTGNRLSGHKPAPPIAGPLASPEYVHSPNANKKRRISNEDEQESLRAKQVPRLYRSPEAPQTRQLSPRRSQPATLSTKDHWAGTPPRSSSYTSAPPPVQMNGPVDTRSALPTLPPTLKFERAAPPMHRPQETTAEPPNGARPPAGANPMPPTMERSPYQSQEYGYTYQHPSRFQSLSTSSSRSYDRAPFSAGAAYGSHYSDMGRYGDMGGISIGGDSKQRKRRGNLPKETTDKLRTWFVAHLQHPYPTEDEKQELMRQTGLQMSMFLDN